MFPLLIPIAIGAIGGALANRRNPLQGALLGGAVGATGGLLSPAAGAAGAAAEATAGPTAVGAAGTAAGTGAGTLSGGSGLLGTIATQAKPAMQSLSLAQQAGLFGGQEQPQQAPAPMQQPVTGPQTLTSVVQQGNELQQQMAQLDAQRRQRRRGLLGMENA